MAAFYSHTQSRLSTQTTWSVFCVGRWSSLNLVKMDDIRAVSELKDVVGDVDEASDSKFSSEVENRTEVKPEITGNN